MSMIFCAFSVAVILAMMAGVEAKPIDMCSVIYVIARLFYILC
jgi:uncharacterized MAPEG superfamily protein